MKNTLLAIILIILIATILIGNPIIKNDNIINVTIGILGIYTIIKENRKIIRNETTKIMLMLLITSALPLILNKYLTLNGTIFYIFRYISIFAIYIITNQELKKETDNLEKIKDVILISGLILVIFGIDLLTTNMSYEFVKKIIGSTTDQESLTRMYSLFLYSNTFAISIVVSYIISIDKILTKQNKIYVGISILLLSGIILSQSRTTILILLILMILYVVIMPKQEKNNLLKLLFMSTILSIIYVTIFIYLKRIGYTYVIWIITLVVPIISILIYDKIKLNEKINKIFKIKNLIIVFMTIVIIFLILSMFKSDLVLFSNENSQTKITKNIYEVKENNKYEIELEIDAKSNTIKDNYVIEFIQRNNYSDSLGEEKIELNNYEGIKKFNINTVEGIKWLEFSVSAKEKGNGKILKIKHLKINGKEFTLNYKFLPTDMVSHLKYINLSQRSVQERKTFIIDGIKMMKNSKFFGIGGDGYKYAIQDFQSYYYGASQMHCYILQIAIEFGIIGLLIFFYLMLLTLKNIIVIIKNKKTEKYSIVLAFVALFLHSFIDFDMTFFYIMIIFYMLTAIINFKENEGKNKEINKITESIILILLIISVIFNINEVYVKNTKENTLKNVRNYEQKTNIEKKYMMLVPYSYEYRMERIEYIKLYKDVKEKELSVEQIENMNNEFLNLLKTVIYTEKRNDDIVLECIEIIKNTNDEKYRELAYKKIEETLKKHKYNAIKIVNDYENLKKVDDSRIKQIIDDNIENSIKNLQEYEKCRITKQQSDKMIEQLRLNKTRRESFD